MTVEKTIVSGKLLPRNSGMRLPSQFALAGGAIMLLAMTLAGLFMSNIVIKAAIENTAGTTALFLESFLAPLVQELGSRSDLSPPNVRNLDDILAAETFKARFPHLQVWKSGGLIAFSTTPSLIGKRFESPPGLIAALDGQVDAAFSEEVMSDPGVEYLKVWIPIREHLSGRVIAAAEIHEASEPLRNEIADVQLETWLLVIASTAIVMLSLFTVVYRGNQVIESQRSKLAEQVTQNVMLRNKAQRANGRVAEMMEAFLRRIGAEIHDGPAQLVAFAAVKVGQARRARTSALRNSELKAIDGALAEAMQDIRQISRSLMLPEIESLSLVEIVESVVHAHERRTGIKVGVLVDALPEGVTPAVKICTYRFIQEGLNNAFRHAMGAAVRVTCKMEKSMLVMTVRDQGGLSNPMVGFGLGLTGLRERAESLGGSFAVAPDMNGFAIKIRLPTSMELQDV